MPTVTLDGETLTTGTLLECAKGVRLELQPEARARVAASRDVVDRGVASGSVIYGINTGFGLFSNVTISEAKLCELQENLIRSHSSGTGEPLSREQTRMLLALRINVLAKGHSGIRPQVMEQMVAAFNADCIPVVPRKGTVGASGDLAPLSHLALGLMGEGKMWDPATGAIGEAADVLKAAGLEPIVLGAKEGLAMINGTQMIAALGAEATERAARIARLADYVAALTLEVLFGTVAAFDPLIHNARPHRGQGEVAARVRGVLRAHEPSELFLSHKYEGKVQDAYSLRCVPQVHGIAHDTVEFVRGVLNVELNSATDNPMCFTQEQAAARCAVVSPEGQRARGMPTRVVPPAGGRVDRKLDGLRRGLEPLALPRTAGRPHGIDRRVRSERAHVPRRGQPRDRRAAPRAELCAHRDASEELVALQARLGHAPTNPGRRCRPLRRQLPWRVPSQGASLPIALGGARRSGTPSRHAPFTCVIHVRVGARLPRDRYLRARLDLGAPDRAAVQPVALGPPSIPRRRRR